MENKKKIKLKYTDLMVILDSSLSIYSHWNFDDQVMLSPCEYTKERVDLVREKILSNLLKVLDEYLVNPDKEIIIELDKNEICIIESWLVDCCSRSTKHISRYNSKERDSVLNKIEEQWTGIKKSTPPSKSNIFRK